MSYEPDRLCARCGHTYSHHCGHTHVIGTPEPHHCSQLCDCREFAPLVGAHEVIVPAHPAKEGSFDGDCG